ncbi:MAG: hypothetical protein M3Z14_02325 [Candidatus Eremiobacteraeota bacterium]|nr:hypothetical protein [Candidatus Eremiobacteraeota bacterium]
MGFVFKKDAVPHVTICRLKDFDRPLPAVREFEPIDVTVREIALFESLRGGQTTHYEVLGRAALVPEGIIKNVETADALLLSTTTCACVILSTAQGL